MRILIEIYRGWKISFDTNSENFIVFSDGYDREKDKRSYSSCKKYIDDFIEENNVFRQFKAIANPTQYVYGDKQLNIVGLRKDGKYVYDNGKGKQVVSDYDLGKYMLDLPENDDILSEISELKLKLEAYKEKINHEIDSKISKLKITTLKDLKDASKND